MLNYLNLKSEKNKIVELFKKEQFDDRLYMGDLVKIKGVSDKIYSIQNISGNDLTLRDLNSKSNDEVFIFNGWTFVSSPSLQSMDHPVYDLWITGCENI